ncbi:hypothetical protein [Ureibacillus thermosphaericus]|uniref:hypothetical protein n=1 Tax=Ureibacillus thermosphaericus TaxID=51173 RepID=UPI0030C91CF1
MREWRISNPETAFYKIRAKGKNDFSNEEIIVKIKSIIATQREIIVNPVNIIAKGEK